MLEFHKEGPPSACSSCEKNRESLENVTFFEIKKIYSERSSIQIHFIFFHSFKKIHNGFLKAEDSKDAQLQNNSYLRSSFERRQSKSILYFIRKLDQNKMDLNGGPLGTFLMYCKWHFELDKKGEKEKFP